MGRSAGIGLPAVASMMAGSTSSSASLSEAYEISDELAACNTLGEELRYLGRRPIWGGLA